MSNSSLVDYTKLSPHNSGVSSGYVFVCGMNGATTGIYNITTVTMAAWQGSSY